ncbi:hypothetical protein [Tardiphaga sp.]|uniref:hypothetical protein n=1 Tax=Tardiphaga sp. TaxID=1926292 RepID=UPI002634190E|nr:hypothetical protein [Tardiphaga sp.]MDB5616222.1 hypothetical protein [Tardiphaga sp.]
MLTADQFDKMRERQRAHFISVWLGCCFFALPAQAQNNALGYGLTTCSEFVTSYEPRQRMNVFAWTAGYFTGINLASVTSVARYRDLSGLPPDLVISLLLGHCTQNPRDQVARAADIIYVSLPLVVSKAAPAVK